jgi:hypothetical protein
MPAVEFKARAVPSIVSLEIACFLGSFRSTKSRIELNAIAS